MFEHILVPLDGSRLAEAVLPATAVLAKKLQAQILLFHVIERDAPQQIHGEKHLSKQQEAEVYLNKISQLPEFSGIPITQHVHTGTTADVPHSIVDHIAEYGSCLIIMCTHGRGGIRSWIFGSIAQQVINLSKTPILLVQPERMLKEARNKFEKLLVPLDGQLEHEQALPVAAIVAQACTSEINLAMIVPTYTSLPLEQAVTARMLPGSSSTLLEFAQTDSIEYLKNHTHTLQDFGLKVSAFVQRGDPARETIQLAKKINADLIVMATHAKTAGDAFWSGSVTPQIMRRTHLPLLLVPVIDNN
jgi:nucleotide-binding universal stress UspA family protein